MIPTILREKWEENNKKASQSLFHQVNDSNEEKLSGLSNIAPLRHNPFFIRSMIPTPRQWLKPQLKR